MDDTHLLAARDRLPVSALDQSSPNCKQGKQSLPEPHASEGRSAAKGAKTKRSGADSRLVIGTCVD
jgi:hypothetical protein